jgi:ankyrin repeat protein
MLLEAGASVDALDFDGRTPLMCASSKNSKLCCKALLDYGVLTEHARRLLWISNSCAVVG